MTETTTVGGEAGYEALRAQMLGLARTSGTCAGLLVLLSQGVAAWMAHRSPGPEPPPLLAASPFVDHRHTALVRILASMALAAGTEPRT